MTRAKDILVNLFVLVLILIAGLICLEVLSRCYVRKSNLKEKVEYIENKLSSRHQVNIGDYDETLGWKNKPEAKDCFKTSEFDVCYSINSQGLRNRETSFEKKQGIFRIVALGESNVFGESVNYNRRFTDIIEQSIEGAEVVNMGVQGYGMDQAFLYLEKDGFKYGPDLVVLFVIEDFIDRCMNIKTWGINVFKPRFVLNNEKNGIILQDLNSVKNNFQDKGASNSGLQANITASKLGREWPLARVFKESGIATIFRFYKREQSIKMQLKNPDREYWNNMYNYLASNTRAEREFNNPEDLKKLIFILLSRYAAACREHSVNLLVVYIDPRPTAYLKDFCNSLGINYLDLSDVLIKASQFKPLRFEIDPHYTEYTHKIIGEYTGSYIKEKYKLEVNKDYQFEFLNKF